MAVSTVIEAKANSIRTAVKGKDVREALASSVEDIDEVTENTKSRQDTVEADFKSIQDSEVTRQSNENTRQQNEEIRQNDEISRQNSENTRVTNEKNRQSQETVRQENETLRQSVINAMKALDSYDNSKEYKQFNKTIYQGSTYECIVESVAGVYPNTDNTKWLCIAQKGQDGQGGDMFKSVYDTDKSGIVDNAEKLGGQPPDYYVKGNDFTLHKEDNVYQTAGGASTDITLNIGETLVNGLPINFIASTDNNAAATTINGKSLYKPNTTVVPNLTKGKAYTVWYDSGKDCFFIKASAEGNTIAAHVLAGDTFSNDDDTGLIGTMDLSNLTADNILNGITIDGVTGTLTHKIPISSTLGLKNLGIISATADGYYAASGNTAKLYNASGTLLNTITGPSGYTFKMAYGTNLFAWYKIPNLIQITDKEGTILTSITIPNDSGGYASQAAFPYINASRIFVACMYGDSFLLKTYDYNGTLLTSASGGNGINAPALGYPEGVYVFEIDRGTPIYLMSNEGAFERYYYNPFLLLF